jgi:hypothetical protein
MNQRAGDAGPVLISRRATVAIGIIAAGGSADVALPADAALADPSGAVAVPVDADFDGAPGDASLGIIAAWVSNPTTGVVTVRFCGLPGPTLAVAAQKILVTRKA